MGIGLMGSKQSVSRICFGCEPLGGTDWGNVNVEDIATAISRALELGVNFFDTAPVYGLGLSETRLSEILGERRHDVVIASKGGLSWVVPPLGMRASISRDSSPSNIRHGVEASLRRLRIDCIPIYYIHWPDPNTEIKSTFECLSSLQDEGKIGQIGCSNFSAEQIRAASEVSNIAFVQLPLNLLGEELDHNIVELVIKKKIGVVAYNVLAGGLLTGRYNETSRFLQNDRRSRLPLFQGDAFKDALRKVANISVAAVAANQTCAQYAISRVLDQPGVVSAILGIKNRRQIEENCVITNYHESMRVARKDSE